MRRLKRIIADTLHVWWQSDPLSSGAAVAYYAVFSIPSFLVIIIASASTFINPAMVKVTVARNMQGVVGPETSRFVQVILDQLSVRHAGIGTTVISSIALIITALGVFTQLEYTLSHMWNVPYDEHSPILDMIKKYTIAFLIVIGFGMLVAISTIIGAFWTILAPHLDRILPHSSSFISFVTAVELFISLGGAFTILYKYIPGVHVSWRSALAGGITGSVLFAVGRELINVYFRLNSSINAYGAASFLIILLLWVYYSSQIFFLGAALARVVDRRRQEA